MDFSRFLAFDHKYTEKFDGIASEFPFAYMLIEKQLRNAEGGYADLAKENARKASRISFGRMFRVLVSLWSQPRSDVAQYYMSFERFAWLESGLRPMLSSMGFSDFKENRNLNRAATFGTAYARFMRAARMRGFQRAVDDRKLLSALDKQARKNFERVKKNLVKANVRLFLADGDTLPHSRFYCRAAHEIGVPYIVFSHGYIQDLQLLSIAPIYADYHVTWTEQQLKDLAGAVSPPDAQKVICFGYPKSIFPSEGIKGLALIAWHSLVDCDRAKEMAAIGVLVERARAEGYQVRLRLHPKDRRDSNLYEACRKLNIEVSDNLLETDIRDAEIVLGSYSSVMIEAAMSGKTVLQISDYSIFSFENIDLLKPTDSIREIAENAPRRLLPPTFNFAEFEQFLKSILKAA